MRKFSIPPQFAPILILLCALTIGICTFFGADGLPSLSAMRTNLRQQELHNAELDKTVRSLRREVAALESDPRTIEKAARQELGLARPGEKVFVFSDGDSKR